MQLEQTATKIYRVLIDTWWNVNDFVSSKVSVTALVLIDTWWNVNIVSGQYFKFT